MPNIQIRPRRLDADEPWAVQIELIEHNGELPSLVAIDLASKRWIAAVATPAPPSVQDYIALIAELPPRTVSETAGSLTGIVVLKPDTFTTDPRIALACRTLGIARIFQGAVGTQAERLAAALPTSEVGGIAM